MFKLLQPKHRSMLGIDISSGSVKGVELLCSSNNRYQLLAYGMVPLPPDSVEGHTIHDVEGVSKAIQHLVSQAKFTTDCAVVAVPDSAVISKTIQINDGLNDVEMEEFVYLEAEKFIPFPIQEINLDFQVLGPSIKNPIMIDVLVVATRSENVTSRADAINKAGLKTKIVDVESYAIERVAKQLLFPLLPQINLDNIVALFDIGAKFSNLFILKNYKIIFTREEEFGGTQIERDLINFYGEKAEEIHIRQPETYPEDFKENILEPFIGTIVHHVKRSLQFFFSTTPNSRIHHIVMAGGVAKIPDIEKIIAEKTEIPTTIGNSFPRVELGKNLNAEETRFHSPSLIIACGLALTRDQK